MIGGCIDVWVGAGGMEIWGGFDSCEIDWVGGVIVRSGLFEGQLWVVGQLVDVYVERWRKLSVRIELLKLGARTGGAGDQSLAQGRSTFDRIIVVFAC